MVALKASLDEDAAYRTDDEKFQKFKETFGRLYGNADEEAHRFENFKRSLGHIQQLNRRNPLALFGVTEFADYTAEEKATRKMASVWRRGERGTANSARMTGIAEITDSAGTAGVVGGGGQSASAAAHTWTEATSGKTFELTKSQRYLVEDDCAACNLFPNHAAYSMASMGGPGTNAAVTQMPKAFDWRDLGAVTPVKNQLQCGSCWAFSTVADIEGTHFLATGQLQSFSEQQLVSCDSTDGGCGGGLPFFAMEWVRDAGGIITEAALPYQEGDTSTYSASQEGQALVPQLGCDAAEMLAGRNLDQSAGDAKIKTSNTPLGTVTSVKVVSTGPEDERFMALALVKNGPLSIALNANGMEHYVHGIVGCEVVAGHDYCASTQVDEPVRCDAHRIDHAVTLVGYGVQGETSYWLIKNSWGSSWGEGGYYRLELGAGTCGVADMVVHSVV